MTNKERSFELSATAQASYYRKAMVIPTENGYKLRSYDTIVATYENEELIVNGIYSQTTLRHLKDFINQHTQFIVRTKADVIKFMKEGE